MTTRTLPAVPTSDQDARNRAVIMVLLLATFVVVLNTLPSTRSLRCKSSPVTAFEVP